MSFKVGLINWSVCVFDLPGGRWRIPELTVGMVGLSADPVWSAACWYPGFLDALCYEDLRPEAEF